MTFVYVRIPRSRVFREQHKIGRAKTQSPHAILLHNGDIVVCVGTEKQMQKALASGEIYEG